MTSWRLAAAVGLVALLGFAGNAQAVGAYVSVTTDDGGICVFVDSESSRPVDFAPSCDGDGIDTGDARILFLTDRALIGDVRAGVTDANGDDVVCVRVSDGGIDPDCREKICDITNVRDARVCDDLVALVDVSAR